MSLAQEMEFMRSIVDSSFFIQLYNKPYGFGFRGMSKNIERSLSSV